MPLEFIKSEKDKDRLLLNGFLYHRDKKHETNGNIYWRCIDYGEKHCRGRVITNADNVVKEGVHNHGGNAAFVMKEKIVQSLKDRAKSTTESNHEIVSRAASEIPDSVVVEMPSTSSLKKMLRNNRSNENHLPNPPSRESLILPPQYRETEKKENFLIWDKGAVEDRIIIFGTEENLDLLATAEHWFADGTFDACPTLFSQLYTIHARIEDRIIPLIFVLLSGKSTSFYCEMLRAIKNAKPNLEPSTILIDMELAAARAFKDVFPDITNSISVASIAEETVDPER
ncbi:uncharacterized protein [Venturia canescens]|uniref:uncharacterized protein n=1 Tax=Venturia canescens TaxID=32260 RepID=UPI001C9C09D8|nr:uncharacterized protein LOC122412693 [Venturia canescens]XP_043278366.1 uncharacterized protein LOC122412694 [Venturia canescens]XP_043278367.1 uncharacterized protein LOC122412695 [Venturia canescens]XP_043278368.1 uncharacterized protein LOC122412697 [Venturia canescens]